MGTEGSGFSFQPFGQKPGVVQGSCVFLPGDIRSLHELQRRKNLAGFEVLSSLDAWKP